MIWRKPDRFGELLHCGVLLCLARQEQTERIVQPTIPGVRGNTLAQYLFSFRVLTLLAQRICQVDIGTCKPGV